MDRSVQLGQFLRARRARITPAEAGIAEGDRRRVPGLRREELAMLAGLSADYYTRLEQGRYHRPSQKVLTALAQALQLDTDATAHLFRLGGATVSDASPDPARHADVAPDLRDLLDAWTTTPALIHGRWLDVLASNPLARALTPLSEPGTNMLRSVFLNPDVRQRYADPDWASATVVAYLRASVGDDAGNPELNRLLGELSLASEAFRGLWAQHDVQSALSGNAPLVHPVVGEINFRYQTFTVHGADRQTLMVIHTAPGSPDAQALARLATFTGEPLTPED